MNKHNINSISFMIASFKDIVDSFGKKSESVSFFKRQIDGLCSINQLSLDDVDLVYRLLGIVNTDAIKWDIAETKLAQYISAMNMLIRYNDATIQTYIIYNLDSQDKISSAVKEIICETLGLDIKNVSKNPDENKLVFGQYKRPTTENLEVQKLKKLMNSYPTMIIKIKNSNAVCSSDRSYYECKVADISKTKSVLKELASGQTSYTIGVEKSDGDPCHPRHYIETCEEAMAMAHSINWDTIYKIMNNNKY